MEFVDKAFARRLEATEEVPQVHHARPYKKLYPGVNAAEEEICGGHMVFAGVGSPIGRAVGLGLNGPISSADLDRLEQFYRSRGAAAQVDVCPLTDSTLIEMLKRRCYCMTELNNVPYRKLRSKEPTPEISQGVNIRPANSGQAGLAADISSRSFFPEGNPPDEFPRWIGPMYQYPGVVTLLAWIGEKPVASAAGLIIAEHNVFAMFGDATLPEFRKGGIQSALVQARLRTAAEAGLDLAAVVTRGGGISQRNYERMGFRVAYSKATLVKTFE
jgi:GNAT superfamily N-acetyltransferase